MIYLFEENQKLAQNVHTRGDLITNNKDIRDKIMDNKLMYIPNDDTQNYPFCGVKIVVETFEHST